MYFFTRNFYKAANKKSFLQVSPETGSFRNQDKLSLSGVAPQTALVQEDLATIGGSSVQETEQPTKPETDEEASLRLYSAAAAVGSIVFARRSLFLFATCSRLGINVEKLFSLVGKDT